MKKSKFWDFCLVIVIVVEILSCAKGDDCLSEERDEFTGKVLYRQHQHLHIFPVIPTDAVKAHLQCNEISTIPQNAFVDLVYLQKVDLTQNKLKTVSETMFVGLTNLKTLILSNNSLRRIESGAFVHLPSLFLGPKFQ